MSPNKRYATVTIVYKDGHQEEFIINASAAAVPTAVNNSHETGFVCLYNNDRNMCIAVDEIAVIYAEPLEIN